MMRFVPGFVLLVILIGSGCSLGGPQAAGPPGLLSQARGGAPTMAELQAVLQAEFARLGVDPAKVASTPPDGLRNEVLGLEVWITDPDAAGPVPPDHIVITWVERNIGDYDMNSEVGMSDLTPLGMNFGGQVSYNALYWIGGVTWVPLGMVLEDGGAGPGNPPFTLSGAYNWRLALIDGDNNGEINLGDITPIAQHWGSRVDGYIIERIVTGQPAEVLPNLSNPASPLSVQHSALYPPGSSSPDPYRALVYNYNDPWPAGATEIYYSIKPCQVDGAQIQSGARSGQFVVLADNSYDLLPFVRISGTVVPGAQPPAVFWSTADSTDMDGFVVSTEWDADLDGVYEINSTPSASTTVNYPGPGTYVVHAKLTDDAGYSGVGIAEITF